MYKQFHQQRFCISWPGCYSSSRLCKVCVVMSMFLSAVVIPGRLPVNTQRFVCFEVQLDSTSFPTALGLCCCRERSGRGERHRERDRERQTEEKGLPTNMFIKGLLVLSIALFLFGVSTSQWALYGNVFGCLESCQETHTTQLHGGNLTGLMSFLLSGRLIIQRERAKWQRSVFYLSASLRNAFSYHVY